MFTLNARDLATILDQAAPHLFQADDDARDLDALILDCTPGHLHVVACSDRTLAVARTPVAGAVWTAPLAYDDAAALRGWLESSDAVTVEHVITSGHQQLRFTEGNAQLTVPTAPHIDGLPWRELLRLALNARDHATVHGRPVQLSSADLSLWLTAGGNGEAIEFSSLGAAGTVVTAGPDFLGVQTPHGWDGPAPGEGWASSLRTRLFLFRGQFLEVGARYADCTGSAWVVPARPGPGEEPRLISADHAAVALPISQVLAVGKFLVRLPA
ncbi:hypothetical protein ABZ370_08545 [Streptomyces sp. NPDC005962]|uniref:hypothetical protein n=1 Tax=Streptomyces sp. NPDC005962 TaxID=3154466 RepID=UPI0033FA0061